MALNPIWNRFNVAPIHGIIVVGHRKALHSGLTRENAINLAAWLMIATEASPEEIAREIAHAESPTPQGQSSALGREGNGIVRPAVIRVQDKKGQVIDVPSVAVVPNIKPVDVNAAKLRWVVPPDALPANGTEE